MPRKSTKKGSEAHDPASVGADTPSMTSIAEIFGMDGPEGKPLQIPAKEGEKKKIGRPSTYTPEIARKMCELLSEGVPLREICRMDGMPPWRTVYDWMYKDDSLGAGGTGLSAHIARARDVGQDAMAERAYSDMYEPPERILSEGGGKIDPGYVQLVKARAEITLKLLAKWNPKKYGDRTVIAGDAENPLEIQNSAMEILAAAVKNMELKRQAANE